jgi:hypothetical protein
VLLPKLEAELRRGAQVLSYMFRWARLLLLDMQSV